MTTCMCIGQFDLRSREGPRQIFTRFSNPTLVVRPGIGYRMVLWPTMVSCLFLLLVHVSSTIQDFKP